uniref:DUF4806 domain-containing protein n=1 Tax=Paramormyrops kingsleyae TaxID=1676925 RepID=A0A3B3RP40_9TELE
MPKKSKRRKRPKSRWIEDESDEELPQKQTKKLPQAPRIKPSTHIIVKPSKQKHFKSTQSMTRPDPLQCTFSSTPQQHSPSPKSDSRLSSREPCQPTSSPELYQHPSSSETSQRTLKPTPQRSSSPNDPHLHPASLEPYWHLSSSEPCRTMSSPGTHRLMSSSNPCLCSSITDTHQQHQNTQQCTSSLETRLSGAPLTQSTFASLLHKILTNQEMMMDQLKMILRNIQTTQGTDGPSRQDDDLNGDLLPIKDLPSLLDLERNLRDDADLKKKMIAVLGHIGGVDTKDTVWRIMKYTLSNSLAKMLNWRGINGKTAFHNLILKYVITGKCLRITVTITSVDKIFS